MQIFDKYLQVLTITLIFLQPVASKAKQEDPSRVNANFDFALPHFFPDVGYVFFSNFSLLLGDLKTWKVLTIVVKQKSIFRGKLANFSLSIIYFGSQFLVDLQFCNKFHKGK